ncbi:N-acetyl-gamma-glutamyl-phosphate reductase [Ruficoccus amylovorans]|uniref:N-acetyl-gamma-glutamyl-phosphate reductase n=1 Tax=Ruficoccus amylovorans TaxID=1804625 RepID=A0A842HJ77_9BACT|nr:N-acetyl-gamma-glutamyl-phosphate reductase [Ruficoccus amylovorans]MBC2596439.1 N-acetyl-gamma-glutamyl-phosphate reductase [Ruficoccus amylovorans]
MKTAIVGASGYSGEELVRLLSRHPQVELALVSSRSLVGKPLVSVMPQFRGLVPADLVFSDSDPATLAARDDIDVFFLALPHGVAAEFAVPLVEAGRKVIDLSADFRLGSTALYEEFYGQAHPAPALLEQAAYVIPEITPAGWEKAPLIASPGCYPTSIITPLTPLLRAGIVSSQGIVVNSMSGVSGAGKKLAEAYLYCERNESVKAYGLPKHRHLSEIEEQLGAAAGEPVIIQFNPHLAPMKRGIATTITVPAAKPNLAALYAAWETAFAGRPFIGLLPSGTCPDTLHVTGTNRVDMSAVYDERTKNFIITSAEDNVVKGASGQAVQIMNLWLGFKETDGLL